MSNILEGRACLHIPRTTSVAHAHLVQGPDSQRAWEMDGPPADDFYSVCHSSFNILCQSNCSHWFCGALLLLFLLLCLISGNILEFGDSIGLFRCLPLPILENYNAIWYNNCWSLNKKKTSVFSLFSSIYRLPNIALAINRLT